MDLSRDEHRLPPGMTEDWARASRTLGGRLAHYRRLRDMTREDVAHLVRRSESTVRRWELNVSPPSLAMLALLATALRVHGGVASLLPPEHRAPVVVVDDAGQRQDAPNGLQTSLLEQDA